MSEINSQDHEQMRTRMIEFIAHELKMPSLKITSDFVINKGRYILDSEKIHTILARIADDTGDINGVVTTCVFI
ncbi:unnamed protein product [Commensalibacter communis]|uniref:hypothetical protein n=1 Tax=Commensalibacter communis TaxID=2972786 RepID=UPI0022FF54B5|nr:hypothetical protein [Commensalibacter communis]CAI3926445.1 unnamed protein product [Commensalibacter communis]CAI3932926.1 unnamed protein product [Commensalibacter communis]